MTESAKKPLEDPTPAGEAGQPIQPRRGKLPTFAAIRADAVAGLNSAISSVPDGMAMGLLAGVNPIFGLYASIIGPAVGGLLVSTRLMVILTTSASALIAGQAISGLPEAARESSLFLLVVLIGVFQVLFGLFRLGSLTRFISFSVMTGFITGIAVLTILSQLSTVTGYSPSGDGTLHKTWNLLNHLSSVEPATLGIAVATMLLFWFWSKTPLRSFGPFLAVALPSIAVFLLSLKGIELVRDAGELPGSLPLPALPNLSFLTTDLITTAAAIAIIILVQGAGVSQSVPNPDGTRGDASRDFIAQGVANIASGAFRGLPVGASLSMSALSAFSGATSRLAAIFSGVWMGLILLLFVTPVSLVAMPALGALLILAMASTIKPTNILGVWHAGWAPFATGVVTFLATLLLPIQLAVAVGAALSAALALYRSSADISLFQLVKRPDGRMEEQPLPEKLPSNAITVLDVEGNLFYGGARTLEGMLPSPIGTRRAVVILRLKRHASLGATLINILVNYARALDGGGGRLYISAVSEQGAEQINRSEDLLNCDVHVFPMTAVLLESTERAYADAEAWLREQEAEPVPDDTGREGAR